MMKTCGNAAPSNEKDDDNRVIDCSMFLFRFSFAKTPGVVISSLSQTGWLDVLTTTTFHHRTAYIETSPFVQNIFGARRLLS